MTKVVSVIVTYNGTKWITRCLECLRLSTLDHKIIVVDNKSTDGTPEIVSRDFPEVELVPNLQNLGFGKANNIGIKAAIKHQPDYIFILNQDVYVEPSTLRSLANIAGRSDKYGIISPVHTTDDSKTLDRGFKLHMKKSGVDINTNAFQSHSEELLNVEFVNAAAWFVSANALKKVGGFDPIFTHYGEDDHLASRMRFHGFEIVVYTGSRVVHDRDQSENEAPFDPSIEYRNFLARAAALQNDMKPEYVRTIKKWTLELLRSAMKFRLQKMLRIINLMLRSSINLGKIRRTRKITSDPPYPYLYIDVR